MTITMNSKIALLTLALIFSNLATALAGGGQSSFQNSALPLLAQSPAIKELLVTKFLVEEIGAMGPLDAPFDGARKYTYMEFQATFTEDKKQKFIVKIHFKPMQTLERVEFIPLAGSSKPG